MDKTVHFENWWSKVLFEKAFENQFVIPLPPAKPVSALLNMIERRFDDRDLAGLKIDRPIFIVGLPRSGTSMLYNLLCAHEKAFYVTNSMNSFPDSIRAIEWARKKFKLNIRGERFLQDSIDSDFSSPSEPAMFWGKWIGRETQSLFWTEKPLSDFSPEKLDEIYSDIKKILFTFGGGDRRFVCKYPVFQTELGMINQLFPDAHFIHIIRDGRQVANSLVKLYKLCKSQIEKIKHPDFDRLIPYPRVENLEKYITEFGPDDIRCTAHVWEDSISVVDEVKDRLHRFVQVRYEDILAQPKEELGKLFAFAGLDWPAENNTLFQREFAGIGKIRHTNKYGQFDVVENLVGPTLKRLGY
jgi:hypothetical protein